MLKQAWPWRGSRTLHAVDMNTEVLALCEAHQGSDVSLENLYLGSTGSTIFEVDEQRYIVSGHAQVRIQKFPGNGLTSSEASGVSIQWKAIAGYRDISRNRPDGHGSISLY